MLHDVITQVVYESIGFERMQSFMLSFCSWLQGWVYGLTPSSCGIYKFGSSTPTVNLNIDGTEVCVEQRKRQRFVNLVKRAERSSICACLNERISKNRWTLGSSCSFALVLRIFTLSRISSSLCSHCLGNFELQISLSPPQPYVT